MELAPVVPAERKDGRDERGARLILRLRRPPHHPLLASVPCGVDLEISTTSQAPDADVQWALAAPA